MISTQMLPHDLFQNVSKDRTLFWVIEDDFVMKFQLRGKKTLIVSK